jgi:hypothetical protein
MGCLEPQNGCATHSEQRRGKQSPLVAGWFGESVARKSGSQSQDFIGMTKGVTQVELRRPIVVQSVTIYAGSW